VGEGGYRIEVLPGARRDLAGLPPGVRRRVATAIDALATEPRPHGSKRLVGRAGEPVWRLRVGDYRVLYLIREATLLVLIVHVGHRRDVYRARSR
jgi:mRNA interferase RelE/StbE